MKDSRKQNKKKLSYQKILMQWKVETPEWILNSEKQRSDRRRFISQSLSVLGSIAVSPRLLADNKSSNKMSQPLSEPWFTLAQVQEQLFPRGVVEDTDEISPGASDINAIGYLQTMTSLDDFDQDEKKFILKGVDWLNGISDSLFSKPFVKLKSHQREQVLKKISTSESGESWLSTLLSYIFEALLTDPIYGGNTEQKGWRWLQHQAGFPRPPKHKPYWLIRNPKGKQNV